VINWALVKHPLNWLIVLLMLTIAGIAGHIVLTHFGAEPQGSSSDSELPPGQWSKQQVAAAILS
jgi:hypothetical protein